MYKYKRGISNIEQLKIMEYMLTDNKNTYTSLTANLEIKRPYNGLYIQDGKILVLNVLEKVLFKDKEYDMSNLSTSIKNSSCDEYISSIDLQENTFEYNLGSLSYKKRLELKDEILCIEYDITNKENSISTFKIYPLLTYRKLNVMKTSNLLRFGQRKIKDGIIVNLSIVDSKNIIIKSKDFKFIEEHYYINNIKHEHIDEECVRNINTEDAYLPGEFEVTINSMESKKVRIYLSSSDFDINQFVTMEDDKNNNIQILENIAEEYVELRELASQIEKLDMENLVIPSIPYEVNYETIFQDIKNSVNSIELEKYIKDLTKIVRAVDGAYLSFDKIGKAKKVLVMIRKYIKILDKEKIENEDITLAIINLKLWYVESVHRLLQKDNTTLDIFYDFVKEIINTIIQDKNNIDKLDDIENISLLYNALKIYENMMSIKDLEDIIVFKIREEIKEKIENEYWIEDKRIMKKSLKEKESFTNVQMIYTLSLSYPCVVGDKSIKILDTIFKELYTPYGLREFSKGNENSKGNIYPLYMAHFVKANLRQNGVTRASQKIAYNLVKELMQEISKYTSGGIKEVYNEKGIHIDKTSYDLLTNAEVIRLYCMLT